MSVHHGEPLFGMTDTVHLSEALQGRHKVGDTAKLSVDRSKAHIGHLTHRFELFQHQLADFSTGDFPFGPLLENQFDVIHEPLEHRRLQARFLASPEEPVEEFGAVEGFTTSIAFDHRDGDGFHPLVGGEPEITVQTFTTAPHTSAQVGCSRLKNPAIGVLARRALHAQNHIY